MQAYESFRYTEQHYPQYRGFRQHLLVCTNVVGRKLKRVDKAFNIGIKPNGILRLLSDIRSKYPSKVIIGTSLKIKSPRWIRGLESCCKSPGA